MSRILNFWKTVIFLLNFVTNVLCLSNLGEAVKVDESLFQDLDDLDLEDDDEDEDFDPNKCSSGEDS